MTGTDMPASVEVRIRRIPSPSGRLPSLPVYETEGAAAMDLRYFGEQALTLSPGGRAAVPTGLSIELPPGWVALLFARSGLAVRDGVTLANGVGVIDSDYRGEIRVGLLNTSDRPVELQPEDRVAQIAFFPVPRARLVEVSALGETQRGEGGFGSTGRA